MIDKLRVRNFRCLRDVEVPLGPLTFLIGPNNTGKSSLLDAVELLCTCVRADNIEKPPLLAGRQPEGAERLEQVLKRVLTDGAAQPRVSFDCDASWSAANGEVSRARYHLALALAVQRPSGKLGPALVGAERVETLDADGNAVCVVELQVAEATRSQRVVTRPPGGSTATPGPPPTRTMLRSDSLEGDAVAVGLSTSLTSTPKYSLVPDEIAKPCSARPVEIAGNGSGLAASLARISSMEPEKFDRIESALAGFAPGVKRVTFPDDASGQKTILFHEQWGTKVPGSEASDGLLLFLAYLAMAYAHKDVGILLVEEPETGVHPNRLRDIVRLLRAMSRGELGLPPVQVVATSHSPHLLDWCTKDEVIFFDRDERGDIRTKPLWAVPDIDERVEDFESLGAWIYCGGGDICKSRS